MKDCGSDILGWWLWWEYCLMFCGEILDMEKVVVGVFDGCVVVDVVVILILIVEELVKEMYFVLGDEVEWDV